MIRINLIGNNEHFGWFCRAMDGLFSCRSRHCENTCWAGALRSVQKNCNGGMGVNAATRKWAETGLTHKDGEEIWCDLLKVDDLEKVRELLREDKNVEEK